MSTRTYSPKEVNVIINGFVIDQFTKVTIEDDEDGVEMSAAATGEPTRTIKHNENGKVTIDLPQSALKNSRLTALYKKIRDNYNDITAPVSDRFASITVEDKLGGSKDVMPEGTPLRRPNNSYEASITDRTWVFVGQLTERGLEGNV